MEEVEFIYNGNTNKLKHIYKNKNYKLQNVLGYCFICLEDLGSEKMHYNYLCHNNLYSLCSSCYTSKNKCLCSSEIIDKNILYYCETSNIDVNQIIFKHFYYCDIVNRYYLCKNFCNFHIQKNIDIMIKKNMKFMFMILKSEPIYETSPRLLQITIENKEIIINKMIEGSQETIISKKVEMLNVSNILEFLENEKIVLIDLGNDEDVLYSEYFITN